ncbi:MAG: hypothetical protein RIC52_18270, partial [Amphiplicatus sp.]
MPLMKLSPIRWAAIAVGAMAFGAVPGVASAAPQSSVDAGLRIAGELVAAGVSNGLTSLPALAVEDDRG